MAAGAYAHQSVERADCGQNGSSDGQESSGQDDLLSCTRFKLHLLLSQSGAGADLQQTELMRNIHVEINCPSC